MNKTVETLALMVLANLIAMWIADRLMSRGPARVLPFVAPSVSE